MRRDFFLSYTAADRDWAEWIAWTLGEAGYTIVVQAWDFRPGTDFVQAMYEALSSADTTIAIASSTYFQSSYSTDEWTAAFLGTGDRRDSTSLLIVRVEPVQLPRLLSTRIYVDLFGVDRDTARLRLLAAVSKGRGKPTQAPAFPEPIVPQPPEQDASRADTGPTIGRGGRATVFISYSHEDRKWLDRLSVHLRPLERAGFLDVWDDEKIKPGMLWKDKISDALKVARVAILLVSADFLASDFIMEYELPTLLAAAEREGTIIMPVIVGPSRFLREESLSRFQAFNPPQAPLSKMTRNGREELLVLLANEIEEAIH
jgi:TIR domain